MTRASDFLNAIFLKHPSREPPKKIVECSRCRDFGFVETDGHRGVPCPCVKRKQVARMLQRHGLTLDALGTFDEFVPKDATQRYALNACRDYAGAVIRHDPDIGWLMLSGHSGTGKSMLARAILRKIIESETPVGVVLMPFLSELKRLKDYQGERNERNILEEMIIHADLLYVEDFLKDKINADEVTRADLNQIFPILESRYNAKKPTIFSTELSITRIKTMDASIGGRVIEMCGRNIFSFTREHEHASRGGSYRTEKKP